MKRFSLSLMSSLALATASPTLAQTLTVAPAPINFGTTTELAAVQRTVTISNPTAAPINVTSSTVFPVYGLPAWSVSPAQFTVPAQGTFDVTVTFAPQHNIQHESEVVFQSDHLGAVRAHLTGQGQYANTYYNATQNQKEQALLGALKQITTAGHNALGYDTGRDRMFMVIDNRKVNGQGAATNTVECIYTGRLATGYTSRSQAQSQNFNTEHTWPQSFFNSANPMVSDIHHLFPTDNSANGSRSNLPFGVATMPYSNNSINNPSHLGANGRYEPRDVQKGRTARAMLYFVTRYQNYSGFFTSQQAVLRKWSKDFPVNQVDRKRNDDVKTAQGNRNPFVDYPQFADRISNFVGNPSVAPDSVSLFRSAASIEFGTVSQAASYTYVLVNNGTTPFTLTNATTTTTAGTTLTVTPTAATLAPGQGTTLTVNLNPAAVTGAITGTVVLATNLPGANANITVPVNANATVMAVAADVVAPLVTLVTYPNPATGELTVVRQVANPTLAAASAAYDVTLLDELGRAVRHTTTTDALTVLDLHGVAPGLYVVRAGGLSRRVLVR